MIHKHRVRTQGTKERARLSRQTRMSLHWALWEPERAVVRQDWLQNRDCEKPYKAWALTPWKSTDYWVKRCLRIVHPDHSWARRKSRGDQMQALFDRLVIRCYLSVLCASIKQPPIVGIKSEVLQQSQDKLKTGRDPRRSKGKGRASFSVVYQVQQVVSRRLRNRPNRGEWAKKNPYLGALYLLQKAPSFPLCFYTPCIFLPEHPAS
jgi:hypothetical protein